MELMLLGTPIAVKSDDWDCRLAPEGQPGTVSRAGSVRTRRSAHLAPMVRCLAEPLERQAQPNRSKPETVQGS
jgi:hypothetical protein